MKLIYRSFNQRYGIDDRNKKKEKIESGFDISKRVGLRITDIPGKYSSPCSDAGFEKYIAIKGKKKISGDYEKLCFLLEISAYTLRDAVRNKKMVKDGWKIFLKESL